MIRVTMMTEVARMDTQIRIRRGPPSMMVSHRVFCACCPASPSAAASAASCANTVTLAMRSAAEKVAKLRNRRKRDRLDMMLVWSGRVERFRLGNSELFGGLFVFVFGAEGVSAVLSSSPRARIVEENRYRAQVVLQRIGKLSFVFVDQSHD